MSNALMPNYARLPVTFVKGEGAWLWDDQGIRYLDAVGGIAVCCLGHAHHTITTAICDQAKHLIHTSNLYQVSLQQELAEKLVQLSGMETAFFCNSGAEANEAAIKIARLYGHSRGVAEPTIVVTEGAFHGRTLATLTATGNPKIRDGFEPLVPGFLRVPYNDVTAIADLAEQHPEIVAILVEPVTGEGGVVIPNHDYLVKLRSLCDRHNWLLMLDEIQTGMGRTGKWFAYQHAGIHPEVLTLAKGLGNGLPIGACLARGKVAEIFKPGKHGSTFGGNPLVCRVALAVIKTIESDDLLPRIIELGQRFAQGFSKTLAGLDGVVAIRVKGLMIGIELDRSCGQLASKALQKQLLINVTAERVIRLLPPCILSDAQADSIIAIVSHLVKEYLSLPAPHQ